MSKSVQQKQDKPADKPVVLVVDDSPDDRLLLHTAAQEVCPAVTFVFMASAEAALAYLMETPAAAQEQGRPLPNLLLLDHRLTGMQGLAFLRQLRALPGLKQLKILIWSGSHDPELRQRVIAAGADGFLAKAASFPELLEDVRSMCKLSGIAPAFFAPPNP